MHTSDPHYDVLVVGLGAIGSAALYHLAKRGQRVLGVERFAPGHGQGSSHGETRVIRTAYHEHPDYVPLLERAIPLWRELEEEAGEKLYWEVGCLEVGPPDGEVVSGVLQAAEAHDLAVEVLSREEVETRFPGFSVPEGMVGVFEKAGGVLAVEACVRAHTRCAQQRSAEVWTETEVSGIHEADSGFEVQTSRGRVHCDQVIISAGAWASDWLGFLEIPFEVVRKPLVWFEAEAGAYSVSEKSPVFLFEMPEGLFYGFPAMDSGEVKLAEHSGGRVVADPLRVDRDLHEEDSAPLATFVRSCLPRVNADEVKRFTLCMYTQSPDGHFVVGRAPHNRNLAFAAGLSGHGFKFSGVLGEVLAQCLLDGETTLSMDVFSPERFS